MCGKYDESVIDDGRAAADGRIRCWVGEQPKMWNFDASTAMRRVASVLARDCDNLSSKPIEVYL